ncbi:MAG TPA: hypothetical protein VN797_05095 [Gemmatimonadaceae bacterium]|jgi:hypothetical protein|nr:hypothetical protein [Gemmatimonadaceae bacterium]
MSRAIVSRLLSWGVALLLMCPQLARAQAPGTSPSPRPSTSCLDRIAPSAFTRVAVYAFVHFDDSVSTTLAATADNFLQELVFSAQKLLGMKGHVLPEGEPTVDWRGTEAPLSLTAYRDGRIVPHNGTLARSSAAALMARALDSLSTAGLLEWADPLRDSVHIDIDFVRPTLDSAGHITKPKIERTGVLLLSILAPWERPVSLKPGQRGPSYPDDARRTGYQAEIVLSFIVDSTGRAVESTIEDLWPKDKPKLKGRDLEAYESFVETTKRRLPELEFVPATIAGCPVKQRVQMPFVFTLRL